MSAVVARLESAVQEKNDTTANILRLEDNLEEVKKVEKEVKQKFKLLQRALDEIYHVKQDVVETLKMNE